MAKRTCTIDDCDRDVHGRGYCLRHYKRWRKYGDPLGGGTFHDPRARCSIPGCERPYEARGWCNKHYLRWRIHGDPEHEPHGSFESRVWSRIDREHPSGCWIWTGARTAAGYGSLKGPDGTLYAHRTVYEMTIGEIPDGMVLMHSCDTPPCCNPEHLSPGTDADNNADMIRKGRAVWQRTRS